MKVGQGVPLLLAVVLTGCGSAFRFESRAPEIRQITLGPYTIAKDGSVTTEIPGKMIPGSAFDKDKTPLKVGLTALKAKIFYKDPEDDPVSFQWVGLPGDAKPTGAEAEFKATKAGTIELVLMAMDDREQSSTLPPIYIKASNNDAPEIKSITISSPISPGASVPLSVETSDPDGDEVTLEVQATAGSITPSKPGTGTLFSYAAPTTPTSVTIFVTAKDDKGGQTIARKSIEIK